MTWISFIASKVTLLSLILFLPLESVDAGSTFFEKEFDTATRRLLETQFFPRSVVYAYRCFALKDRLISPERLENQFKVLLKSSNACAILKDHLNWFLADIEFNRNETRAAKKRLKNLGLIDRWWMIGPFDNEGKAGFNKVYGPEEHLNLDSSYRGKLRTVRWRPFPPINHFGYQDFRAVYRPYLHVCAYALAVVHSERQQSIAIRTGSDDAIKVWLNGQLRISNSVYRAIGFDQDAAGGVLRKGFNTLLVKVCQKEGRWGFRLRLTAPEGGPLSGISIRRIRETKDLHLKQKTNKAEMISVTSPLDDLKKYAESNLKSFQAYYDLGYFLEVVHPHDSSAREHIKAYQKAHRIAPRELLTLLRLAQGAIDHNQRRVWYEKALEISPNFAPALYGIATYYASRGDRVRQLNALEKAIDNAPNYFPAELFLARSYSDLPLRGKGWYTIQGLKNRFPNVPWIDYQMGQIASDLGFMEESNDAYQRYLSDHWMNNGIRNLLLKRAIEIQDLTRSFQLYKEMIEVDPGNLSIRKSYALLLANNGKIGKSARELMKCLDICPEDGGINQSLGDIYDRMGKRSRAISLWKKSLKVHPQNPNLRDYLDYVVPDEDQFEIPFLVDAKELASQPIKEKQTADESAVQMAHILVEKLYPNGTTHRYSQEVIRILNERGAKEQRFQNIFYSADLERANIESYRVIKSDGRELTAGTISERRMVTGEQNTFYDYRVKILRLPQLEPGDVIELQYRVSDIANRNYFGKHFGQIMTFQTKLPIQVKKYVLITPKDRKLFYSQERIKEPDISHNDWTTYIWTAREMPALPNEPLIPSPTSVIPYVHISSFQSWNEVAKYYGNMISDQFQSSDMIRETVKQITKGKKTEIEKIRALYHYLSRKTRYVALEFGIHGYLPYPAHLVFARKYGDCKDKAVLLKTMLKEAGIDSNIALVRTRLRGNLKPDTASLAAFDHCIAYVPKHNLWLDCTTEFNGTNELPDMNRGALALVIGRNGQNSLVSPPVTKASDNKISTTIQAVISIHGELKGSGTEIVTGSHCPNYRRRYQQKARHRSIFEGAFRKYHSRARITEVLFSNLNDFEKPVEARFQLDISDFVRQHEKEGQFYPVLYRGKLTSKFAPLSERKLPLEIVVPWKREQKITYKLPPNTRWVHRPKSILYATQFGKYLYSLKISDETLEVREKLSLFSRLVTPQEYSAFREFCQKVDEQRSEAIRVQFQVEPEVGSLK